MARYAGGGKNTVESCQSVDVFALEQARLSPIAAAVFMGLDQGRRAGRFHQCPNPAPFRDLEIPKPLICRGLDRCRAMDRHRMDAVSFRWRATMVCMFGCCKRSLLWPRGHQAVRRRATVRLPSLLSARLCEPTGIGASAWAWEITKDPNAAGRKPEHA